MNSSKSDPCTGFPNGTIVLICIAILALAGCNPYAGTLYGAALYGGYESTDRYLQQGSDINQIYAEFHGQTALHAAVGRGSYQITELLLDHGANIRAQDDDGNTPLLLAAIGGHDDMVILLLSRDADPTIRNSDGNTPLHIASIGGHRDMVILLLSRDADATIRNNDGKTPRDLAGRHARIINDLRAAGG